MNTADTGKRYWRSLDDLVQTPEFVEMVGREFPGEAWDSLPPATRRQFLKVMGASLAMAGLTACRWPSEEIVPFASRPEGRTPGVPQRFATALELAGVMTGMTVTSYDGRPIKAEGNPNHPDSLGALSAMAQAAVLELYDPDRSQSLVERATGQDFDRSWDDFAAFSRRHFGDEGPAAGGAGVAVLAESTSSPSVERLRSRMAAAMPEARWYAWEPLSRDNQREGARLAFGRPLRVNPDLSQARIVACFGADPLAGHPAALRLARQFAAARNPEGGQMSRLYAVETAYSPTGAMADHRLAVAPSQIGPVLAALALRLHAAGVEVPGAIRRSLDAWDRQSEDLDVVDSLAADLANHRGAGLILVGSGLEPELHALALALNQALGNIGTTLTLTEAAERATHVTAIRDLAGSIAAGQVSTLLVLGGNPAYDAPADLGFAAALGNVETTIHLSLYRNETSRRTTWHLPRAHAFESWGDGRGWDGTITTAQPLIEPLYGGRTPAEVLALILDEEESKGHDIVRTTLREQLTAVDFETSWRRALHDGVVAGTALPPVAPELDTPGLAAAGEGLTGLLAREAPTADRPELALVGDSKVFDGRFANSGWLQELPDSITKITWDNALLMAPVTAHAMGMTDGDVAAVEVGGETVELPVCLVPGHAAAAVTAALGYGRTAAGRVGNEVGVDTFRLRRSDALHAVKGARLSRSGRSYRLATTQDHHAIDSMGFEARNIRIGQLVREATLDEYLKDPQVIEHQGHHPPLIQLWKAHEYQGEQWGMAIDLNACIGCNACVVACQAENNVPVVGREQVLAQREMHWIRIDRYFRTAADLRPEQVKDAEVVFQPVACVHCENAPCEQVCPVAATQHTRDGLNAMVYNRCVGTRYCSNNCPYKVRRFNFFNNQKGREAIEDLGLNPEVTVRSRGVMEKCTFCTQRIEAVRIKARNERRPIADGEIVPACAQTCPTRAIAFGDLNDPASEVTKLRDDQRGYGLLAELNVRPRTQYLARLRNPGADDGKEKA